MVFKFRLQKILDLKEKEEDNKKNEVALVLREIRETKQELEKIKIMRSSEKQHREDLNSNGCSIQEIREINTYITFLEEQIDLTILKLKELDVKLKEKQDEYLESRKERKSYDKLKEKDHERFKQEEAKQEEKIIDEIVSYNSRKIK